MAQFYSYLWLRADGTPYYAGKGTGKRAFIRGSHHLRPPAARSRILIFPMASEADAIESEKALIEMFGRKDTGSGWADIAPCLRNFTDGGDGVSGLRHTDAAKLKMGLWKKGRPSWNKGVPHTAAHRAALSDGQKRRTDLRNKGKHWRLSAETCRKMSESRKGHTTSEETKKKISAAHLGMRATEETRTKLRESHLGHKPSVESRQKLSESIKQSWIVRRQQGKTNSAGHKHSEESKQKMQAAAFVREAAKREKS